MLLSIENELPRPAMLMLRHCYRYITEDWQHADRLPVPDEGFEEKFRDGCVLKPRDWSVSQSRELEPGQPPDYGVWCSARD